MGMYFRSITLKELRWFISKELLSDVMMDSVKNGISFTADQIYYMHGIADRIVLNEAFRRSEAEFTKNDLKRIEGCVDHDLLLIKDRRLGTMAFPENGTHSVDDGYEIDFSNDLDQLIYKHPEENDTTGLFRSTPETRGEVVKPQGWFESLIAKLRGPEKYIYLGVNFWEDDDIYYYRTEDSSIRKNQVVMVPVREGPEKPAEVVCVKKCTEQYAPYPLSKTKMITGKAKFRDQWRFDRARMKKRMQEKREERSTSITGFLLAWIFIDMFFDD